MHARLAPSSAPVWGRCTGSVVAAQALPQGETDATRNGSAAHWVGEQCLDSCFNHTGTPSDPAAWVGQIAPNGVVIDESHAAGAAVYVNDIRGTFAEYPPFEVCIEQRVYMPTIHAENNGTPDAWTHHDGTIYLWDYKHGHGGVQAEGNLQLINYLEGIRLKLGLTDAPCDLRIVQPNSYDGQGPVRRWLTTLAEVRPYVELLRQQAQAVDLNPTLTSGDHCRYCPAAGRCPALRESGYNLVHMAGLPLQFDRMTAQDLAVERDILTAGVKLIKARLESIEDALEHAVRGGDSSSGLALQSVSGSPNWAVKPDQAIAAAALCGIDISRPHCDTPTQARAKLPAQQRAMFDAAIEPLTTRKSSLKLIRADNTMAAQVFGETKCL